MTAARARGVPEWRVLFFYVGRNAILPLFTQLTIAIGFVVGGSLLVEPIFQYEGIGQRLFQAIQRRDYTLLQGIFLMITISVVLANLIADLLYSRLDPRIRSGRGTSHGRPGHPTRRHADRNRSRRVCPASPKPRSWWRNFAANNKTRHHRIHRLWGHPGAGVHWPRLHATTPTPVTVGTFSPHAVGRSLAGHRLHGEGHLVPGRDGWPRIAAGRGRGGTLST